MDGTTTRSRLQGAVSKPVPFSRLLQKGGCIRGFKVIIRAYVPSGIARHSGPQKDSHNFPSKAMTQRLHESRCILGWHLRQVKLLFARRGYCTCGASSSSRPTRRGITYRGLQWGTPPHHEGIRVVAGDWRCDRSHRGGPYHFVSLVTATDDNTIAHAAWSPV